MEEAKMLNQAVTARIEVLAGLIHERDQLAAERASMTASIDARIRGVEAKLALLLGHGGPASNNNSQVPQPKPGTVKERVLGLLRERPDIASRQLARTIYDAEDEAATNKIRSIIFLLKKDGLITGKWGEWKSVT
jgi:hypothetical protein